MLRFHCWACYNEWFYDQNCIWSYCIVMDVKPDSRCISVSSAQYVVDSAHSFYFYGQSWLFATNAAGQFIFQTNLSRIAVYVSLVQTFIEWATVVDTLQNVVSRLVATNCYANISWLITLPISWMIMDRGIHLMSELRETVHFVQFLALSECFAQVRFLHAVNTGCPCLSHYVLVRMTMI